MRPDEIDYVLERLKVRDSKVLNGNCIARDA